MMMGHAEDAVVWSACACAVGITLQQAEFQNLRHT